VILSPATIGSYLASVGLVGLAIYHLTTGDLVGASTAFAAAFGIGQAANSGPPAK